MRSTIAKILCLLITTFCAVHAISADDEKSAIASFDSPRLATLAKACVHSDASEKARLLETFWTKLQGHAPWIEPKEGDKSNSWVTFLWRGNDQTQRVNVVGGPAPADGNSMKWLLHLPGTDLWYRTELVPNDARFIYIFQVNRPEVLPTDPAVRNKLLFDLGKDDPFNPPPVGQIASLLELPDAPTQPWLKKSPGIAEGTLSEEKTIDSSVLKQKRSFKVYTAPHDKNPGTIPWLLIVFDGDFYSARYPTILDNLKAQGKIPNLTVVFVYQSAQRDQELHCWEPFAEFVTRELMPTVRKEYRLSSEPNHVIIGGASAGGLMAAYCALKHPETYGNVLSMSGAYWWSPEANNEISTGTPEPGWLSRQYASTPKLPIHFFLSAGRFENGYPLSLLAENRRFRDVLLAKSYSVKYSEYSSGHATVCWDTPFVDGLVHLTADSVKAQTN